VPIACGGSSDRSRVPVIETTFRAGEPRLRGLSDGCCRPGGALLLVRLLKRRRLCRRENRCARPYGDGAEAGPRHRGMAPPVQGEHSQKASRHSAAETQPGAYGVETPVCTQRNPPSRARFAQATTVAFV